MIFLFYEQNFILNCPYLESNWGEVLTVEKEKKGELQEM